MTEMTMGQWKDTWLNNMAVSLKDQDTGILSDLWDIALPIIEDIFNRDFDGDGVKDHYREEIWEIVKDKAVEWGEDISEALVKAADGGMLKQLMAAANIAKWATKIGLSSTLYGVVINLLIEWIVSGLKGLFKIGHERLHREAVERQEEMQVAISRLITHLETTFPGLDVSAEHHWGTNMFNIIVLRESDPPEKAVKLYGGLRALTTAIDNAELWSTLTLNYETKIQDTFKVLRGVVPNGN